MVLRIVLCTTLLYQATNTRNTNIIAVLMVLVQKEQWGDFPVQFAFVSV